MSRSADAAIAAIDQGLHDAGDHTHCDADVCFAAKMRYMRSRAGTIFGTPRMAPGVSFYDTTIAEETRKEMARAEAAGNSIEPVGSRWV